jgi:hypothetical protein
VEKGKNPIFLTNAPLLGFVIHKGKASHNSLHQCSGSVAFGTDPDPALLVIDLKTATKNNFFLRFFAYYLLFEDKTKDSEEVT